MLERWSNGRFRATLHCVVNEAGAERFSLPFFYEPALDATVAPLPCAVPAGERPRFASLSAAQQLLAGLGLAESDDELIGEYFHRPPRPEDRVEL